MKKLLVLGGSRFAIPVIETAHKLNIYVITCDLDPDNPAHAFANEYINLDLIDKDSVLLAAKSHDIDGIMSFACDCGVATAAYVAEAMKLPFQGSLEAVNTLQNKGLFREFLTANNFNCPASKSYSDPKAPFKELDYFNWPVIVKPVDSAGSKGVTRVDRPEDLGNAIDRAVEVSFSDSFIIEDFLEFEGYHSSADYFTIDGKLVFSTYSDQLFDEEAENPYVPARIIWPTTMKQEYQDALTSDIQRVMTLLSMRTGIYNIETCVANGKPYIMEITPRGGGCKIAELQKLAYGVDLIEAEVRSAVGMPLNSINQGPCDGHWCELIVHAEPGKAGVLKTVSIDPAVQENNLRVLDLGVKAGDYVHPFSGANMSLGDMLLRFNSREELDSSMDDYRRWLHIDLEE